MPELPEVETIKRGLIKILDGKTIEHVEIHDQRLVYPSKTKSVENLLSKRKIIGVSRRGKYLIIELDDDLKAMHHLRMTGSFSAPGMPAPSHVRMQYFFEDMDEPLSYNDPRRFGTLLVAKSDQIERYLSQRLGPEPLENTWTARALQSSLKGKKGKIKAALLDQKVVAGLGNIYVDEALFMSGIRPDSVSNSVSLPRLKKLVDAIKIKLLESIDNGGSTLRDYRNVSGEVGGMQENFLVYGRGKLSCVQCGHQLENDRIAGRGTVWCSHCQH